MRLRNRVLWTAVFYLWTTNPLVAQQAPRPEDRVMPNFDSRLGGAAAVAPNPQALAAVERLRGRAGARLQVRFDPRTGRVRQVMAPGVGVTLPRGGAARDVARQFLAENPDLFGLDGEDMQGLRVGRESRGAAEGLTGVLFEQYVEGIRVFDAVMSVHVDAQGAVVAASSSARGARASRGAQARLSAEQAVVLAAADIRPELTVTPVLLAGPVGPEAQARYARGPFKTDIDVRLVYFPDADLRLAWRVRLEPAEFPQAYEVLVDATSGRILYRWNLYLYSNGYGSVVQSDATFAASPMLPDGYPSGSAPSGPNDPANGCPPILNYATRSLNAPFLDPLTVLFNTGRLTGNNASVFRGAAGVGGAQGALDEGQNWLFTYPFNTSESAETFLFFAANFVHDFFYQLGFDEAGGNFQADNFGRGGAGGDPVHVVARGDGRNNATFQPNPEGTSPVMSFFLWDGRGCWAGDVDGDGASDLDGAYDLDIIVHEFHHGVSQRLNASFTGHETDAIGEGGSDFFAYSLNRDTHLAEYSYPPSGIRAINAKTYGDWFCFFGFVCEVHANGEIWANVLWDLRERFRGDFVGGSEAAAIDEVHRLYVSGLRLAPPAPTMLDLRDAMLLTDAVRSPSGDAGGSVNHCRMWDEFAGRGMGADAQDTNATGTLYPDAGFMLPSECGGGSAVEIVSLTAAGTANEAGLVPATITVMREQPSGEPLDVRYSAVGSATAGSDYVLLPGIVTIPAQMTSATFDVAPLDDDEVENDETVVVSLAADAAYVVGSPGSATVTVTSDDVYADLAVTSVSGPGKAGAGAAIAVGDTTRNDGAGAAGASITGFYLSANLLVDPGDVLLGSRSVPPLDPDADSSGTISVTIPAETATGAYRIIALANADDAVPEARTVNNARSFSMAIGPDLVVTALDAPSSAGAGMTVAVTETTANTGAGDAGPSVTRFYLSTNTTLDASDVAVGSRPLGPLAPEEAGSGAALVTIPADTATGSYFIVARADGDDEVVESVETNNVKARSIQIGPDLVVSSLTVPSGTGAGSSIVIGDTTKNQGSGTAAASATRFYLSVDYVLDAADDVLGGRAVSALAPGASDAASTSVIVPAGTSAGTYYVIAQADATGGVDETAETNNTRFQSIRIGADLVVSSFSAPATAGAGSSISITETTKNQGAGDAAASTTRFYLSSNASIDAGDVVLGGRSVAALAGGAASSGSTVVTIPSETASGAYYLLAQADAGDAVGETEEGNNVSSRSLQIGSDLIISLLSAPGTAGAGASISVTDTTKNQGTAAAPASTTRFFLSTNSGLDAGDPALGSRGVPSLGAGASSTASTSVAIPPGTEAGTYYLIAKADSDGVVVETQEANNARWAMIQIGPDLYVSTASTPSSAVAGSSIAVSDTTRNRGPEPAGASTTGIFLSTNVSFDAGDIRLGGRVVPPLAAGATDTGSSAVVIPGGTAPGSYYLLIRADADGVVAEGNEINNGVYRPIQVMGGS